MKTFKRKTFYTAVLAVAGAAQSWPMTPGSAPDPSTLDFNFPTKRTDADVASLET